MYLESIKKNWELDNTIAWGFYLAPCYKTSFMLYSTEHKIYSAQKY